ncbi:MAG: indole-3-glycerol phosphate synthase TrpC [Eubacteriales bacterium]|nr:indole-3-glycerol phosphate synthase TrpC [Eubacteriales bacterium]
MILERLAQAARARVEQKKQELSFEEIKGRAEALGGSMDFPFERALSAPGLSFICEVKKASPSKGLIAPDFPYLRIAEEYEAAGAAAVSVLTEPEYFLGSDQYLQEIAENVSIPVLRKDFTVDEYQIYEAKLLGASAVLLICSLLDREQLEHFLRTAHGLGLSALVEAHDETEVRTAVLAGARIIGVNNRDLKTFQVDVQTSLRLRRLVPEDRLYVSESGIRGPGDVGALWRSRADAVLVGESLMKSPDKKAALAALREACHD